MIQIGNCYAIDFSKVNNENIFNLNIKSRDTKRYIDIQLINNSNVVNLSDYTIVVKAFKQDGNVIFNDIDKINVESGRCRMEITPQMLAIGDKLPCEIILYGSDGTIASTSDFALNIIKSSGDEEIISASEFTALSEALKTIASIENIQAAVDTINNILKALNIKGNNILGLDKLVADKIVNDNFYSKNKNHLFLLYDEGSERILLGSDIDLNGFKIVNMYTERLRCDNFWSKLNPEKQLFRCDGYSIYNGVSWDWQGFNILNPRIIGGTTYFSLENNPKARTSLLKEDFSEQNEQDDEITVSIDGIIKHLYLKNIEFENEINQLKNKIDKHESGGTNAK